MPDLALAVPPAITHAAQPAAFAGAPKGVGSDLSSWRDSSRDGDSPIAAQLMFNAIAVTRRDEPAEQVSTATISPQAVAVASPVGPRSIPDLIRIFIGDGTAANPNGGLWMGNGFSFDATTCSQGKVCNGGIGGLIGNGGNGHNGGNGGSAGWFGNGGRGANSISGGVGGRGGSGGLFSGDGGDGGNGASGGAGGRGGDGGLLSGDGGDGGNGGAGRAGLIGTDASSTDGSAGGTGAAGGTGGAGGAAGRGGTNGSGGDGGDGGRGGIGGKGAAGAADTGFGADRGYDGGNGGRAGDGGVGGAAGAGSGIAGSAGDAGAGGTGGAGGDGGDGGAGQAGAGQSGTAGIGGNGSKGGIGGVGGLGGRGNFAPTAIATVGTPNATGAVTGSLATSDADDDTLAFTTKTAPVRGALQLDSATGAFTYAPTADARHAASADDASAGDLTDTFTLAITDGYGGTTLVAVTAAISPNNADPTTDSPNIGEADTETGVIEGQLLASDTDGDTLTYAVADGPAWGAVTVDPGTGAFTYAPTAEARHALAAESGSPGAGSGTSPGLFAGQFGVYQVFDVARSGGCSQTGSSCTVSNFKTPYVAPYTNWEPLTWSEGDYIQFVDTGTEQMGLPNISLVQFDSNGEQKQVVSANGYAQTLGDGILYIGEPLIRGGTGYFISNTLGIDPNAEAYSFATTTLNPTLTELNNYVASSTPLAPGETPNSAPAEEDSFTVVVADGHGGSYTERVTVPITPANAAPTAVTDLDEPDADGAIGGSVVVTDTDGDTTAIVPVIAPTKGAVVLNADGTFTFTPTAEARHAAAADGATATDLTDTFSFAVTDGHGGTTVTVVTVAIAPANTGPTADTPTVGVPDAGTGAIEGQLVAIDADGDTTAVTAVTSPARGVLTVNQATGAFTYTPNTEARHAAAADDASAADQTDTFALAVTDGHGGTTLVAVTVEVSPANAAPVAAAPTVGEPNASTGVVTGAMAVLDADGDTLSYTIVEGPSNGTVAIDSVTGDFVYTPTEAARQGAGAGTGIGTGTGLQTITLSDPAAVTMGAYGGWRGGGGTYNYVATFFTAAETGTYIFGQTSAPVDSVMEIYSGIFDPSAPGVGRLAVNDDTGLSRHVDAGATVTGCGGYVNACPQVRTNLAAGEVVTLVITTYSAGAPLGLPQSLYSNRGGSFSATTPGDTADTFTVAVDDGHGGTTPVSVSVVIAPAPQSSAE